MASQARWAARTNATPAKRPYEHLRSMPASAPLDMPAQDLRQAPEAAAVPSEAGIGYRRLCLLLGSGALAAAAGAVTYRVLGVGGLSVLEAVTLVLSVVLFGWIGFGFITAVAGFLLAWRDGPMVAASRLATPAGRTAILMPIYNEDPGRVMSAVQAMGEDLRRLGAEAKFDFHLLSDTRDEAIAREEASGFLRARMRLGEDVGVFYRRRVKNIDRKAGNIADWVTGFGADYDYMLVLDADSLMSAETIVRLACAMDEDPKMGLLQTAPTIINAETPFARLQQFACRLYGPIFARGQEWWSGSEGNYWGHNAIIRVAAFAESAGLPHLTGPRPFGGHILSHDFVEAALLRRRGWAVRTASALDGSYEETPPTLLDMAARDRRWCQGNLQHIRVLTTAGLHWVSRLHLARGVLSYLTPALWLLLLVCGVMVWPEQNLKGAARDEVVALFGLSLFLLMAPKLMGLIVALVHRSERIGFGGAGRLVLGVLAETALWALAAPVLMVMQCVAVVEVLIGRDSGWAAQRREGSDLSPREAWRAHRGHVLLGVVAALAALLANRYVLMWTSPVFLGLSLSSFLSLHTSRIRGAKPGRLRMFQIPEEQAPPPVLSRALELRTRYAAEADNRRQIDLLFRLPVPVYSLGRISTTEFMPVREAA
ncbi:MAG TPA: glucans biosynthesis glucosyltransferase MdoH [Caulobacteraceae bacterium]|nr:glucans biosynthesis glucosyltransferase MdoH [Caulobacteraceae bacterium]